LIAQIKTFYILEDPRLLGKSGRMPLPLSYLIFFLQNIGMRVIIGFVEGKPKPISVQFFSFNRQKAIFKEVEKRAKNKKIRLAIIHFGNKRAAEELKKMIEENLDAKIEFLTEGSPQVGIKIGPGGFGCSFYEE